MTIVAETNGDFEGDEKKVRAVLLDMYNDGVDSMKMNIDDC